VVLLDPQGREALRLPLVVAALSPRSLWNLGFEQLYIDQPQLEIRRAADGRIFVAGLDFSRGSDNEGRAADWFFSQTEFIIQGGTIAWTDELRGAPPLALSQVDFVARNGARATRCGWTRRRRANGAALQPGGHVPATAALEEGGMAGMGWPAVRGLRAGRCVAAAPAMPTSASR
jgi:hypothetical protein